MTSAAPAIHALGDAAVLCELPAPASLAVQRRIWSLAEQARGWSGVQEVLPGMNNLTLLYDPARVAGQALQEQLAAAWEGIPEAGLQGRLVEIPVAYGGAQGPDLADVAGHTGLSAEEVVRRHTEAEYVVYFLGFLPGFAFLGGLDAALATPRRREPRTAVPAGSVAIGGEQTGVYPLASPGGWQLIGRTSLRLFDPGAAQPTLLQPGDRVRFIRERRKSA